jgi:hypothetical protein
MALLRYNYNSNGLVLLSLLVWLWLRDSIASATARNLPRPFPQISRRCRIEPQRHGASDAVKRVVPSIQIDDADVFASNPYCTPPPNPQNTVM